MNRKIGDLALKWLCLPVFASKWNRSIGGTGGWLDDVVDSFLMGLDDRARQGNLIAGDGEVLDGIGCPIFDGEFG